ncbi:hypothetical protein ACWEQL_22990 [Kitasatospora sp. NPDC004240]
MNDQSSPAPTAAQVTELLRVVAARSGGLVRLDPGIGDIRMDTWPVPVPEEIRALLREIGGVRIVTSRSVVNGHESIDRVDLDHDLNRGGYDGHGADWYQDHAGGPGTHWFVHTDHGDTHTYVDVDRETGAWGPVLDFWDATDTVRAADSLPAWLHRLGSCLSRALDETGTEDVRAFGHRFADLWPEPEQPYTDVPYVTAAEALAGADQVLSEAAAGLPQDARLADLRAVAGPARVDFRLPVTCRYSRHAGGGVLAATPWDGD